MELAIGPEEGISYLTDKGCNVSLPRAPGPAAHAPPHTAPAAHAPAAHAPAAHAPHVGWLPAEGRAKERDSLGRWHW